MTTEPLHIPHVGRWHAYCPSCGAVIPVGVMLPDDCPHCGASGGNLVVLPTGLDAIIRGQRVEDAKEVDGGGSQALDGDARWMGIVWRRVPDGGHPQRGNSDLSRRVEAAGSGLSCLPEAKARQKGRERGKRIGGLAECGDYAHGIWWVFCLQFC